VAASAPRDADALLDVLLERMAPPESDDVTVVALGPARVQDDGGARPRAGTSRAGG
jgi:hypothetical protein